MLSIIAVSTAILIISFMKGSVCQNVLRACSISTVYRLRINATNAYFLAEFARTQRFVKAVEINTI
jgi:hypothetical protein